jgi:hypothetical protein
MMTGTKRAVDETKLGVWLHDHQYRIAWTILWGMLVTFFILVTVGN